MFLRDFDPEVYQALSLELQRQQQKLELIASENFVSVPVLRALGSVLTNKYAEGYPGKRYYGGCEYVDIAENLAIERAKKLFNCEYVNVQPHSGSSANMGVYFAFLNPGDTILSMNLSHGGHLTHGSPVNFSGKFFKVVPYGVREDNNLIDYDMVEKLAVENKPKMIVAGFSAYPRKLDFKKFREIADKVGALLMADVAHPAGLIAARLYPDPIPYCDIVTTTTHKTLRGPRGGMIMSKECHAEPIRKNIFPGIQGGPLMHVIAAKAVAFKEALSPEFIDYQKQTLSNAYVLAEALLNKDFKLVSGGTENHLMLLNLTNKKITGKKAEEALDSVGITVNKNMIPFDQEKPFVTSGIRIGTPALTTRGMKEPEMKQIADFINRTINFHKNQEELQKIKGEIVEFSRGFPLYPELNQPF